MIVWITLILVIVAFLAGLMLGNDGETVVDCERCRGRHWHIWVEPTDDPSKYRAKYSKAGMVNYSVQSNGVANTLRELADEIDES